MRSLGDHFKGGSFGVFWGMGVIAFSICFGTILPAEEEPLPIYFNLCNDLFDQYNYVTPVKHQWSGTCWCHGTLAAVESNLLITGYWRDTLGRYDWPNLAEYHLDWWNGFNQFANDDLSPRSGSGLTIHYGGNYLVASAYMIRGDGPVLCAAANDDTEYDRTWFDVAPDRYSDDYEVFYVRDIEWYVAGPNLENIDTIKRAIMTHGAIVTCMAYSPNFFKGNTFYQSPLDPKLVNHSVAIVGWFDYMETPAEECGAWLAKNSWGSDWGDDGYFWISYYDKWCGQEPNMGAVSFQNVQLSPYDHIYSHDFHGWRRTMEDCYETFNSFTARCAERILAVSFFTCDEDVSYTAKIYDRFENGELIGQLSTVSGEIAHKGFHTVDLETPVMLTKGDDFYVYLELSHGGQAYDRNSHSDRLMHLSYGGPDRYREQSVPTVIPGIDFETMGKMQPDDDNRYIPIPSHSLPGQSYYRGGLEWRDLYIFDNSANFCIKALTVSVDTDLNSDDIIDVTDFSALASAWITSVTDEFWDSNLDLNADKVINAQDIAVLGAEWQRNKSLIAHWKLDESGGVIVHDDAGFYDGEIHGNPQWKPTEGIFGGALFFDGYYDDYVSTPFILDPNEGAFSVFAWIKGGRAGQVIVSQVTGGGFGRNWLAIDLYSERLVTNLRSPEINCKPLSSLRIITGNEWQQVGFVWDGMRRHLYVNGEEVAVDKDALPGLESATEGLCIGTGSEFLAREYFRGMIDDVRIYKGVVEP